MWRPERGPNLSPADVVARYTIADLVQHVGASEQLLVCCAEHRLRTMAQLRKAAASDGGLRAALGCSPEVERELMALFSPPGIPIQWPPLAKREDRIRQHYAHLDTRCRNILDSWIFNFTEPEVALHYLVHSREPFERTRNVGKLSLGVLTEWRKHMRTIVPRTYPLVDPRKPRPKVPEPLLSVVQRTLTAFAHHMRLERWYGKEREAVSFYAFGFLSTACKRGAALHDPGQIAIESRIPAGPLNTKNEVCKDLAIWPKSGANCWANNRESVHHPLVVMEWKAGSDRYSAYDLEHLSSLTTQTPGMVGIAVTFVVGEHYLLRAALVENGTVQEDWLFVE
jgi:hypothetical protein